MKSVLGYLSTLRHQAWPRLWFIYPGTLHWRRPFPSKRLFPFPSKFQLQIVSWLGVDPVPASPSQCWGLCGLNLCRSCVRRHSLCAFTCAASLLFLADAVSLALTILPFSSSTQIPEPREGFNKDIPCILP